MGRKIRWAVIGSGGIARRRVIPEGILQSKNAKLIAVYDINAKINSAVAKETNATAASSIEEPTESKPTYRRDYFDCY